MKTDNPYTHRIGSAALRLTGRDGEPLVHKEVVIRQVKHAFLFGCSEFSTLPYANGEMDGAEKENAERRYEKMFDLFSAVTLPFYWGRFEQEKGKPDMARMEKATRWLQDQGCTLKGHPLCWHTVTAPWLMELSNPEILSVQLDRINRDVRSFAGLVDMWDVINEVVIMPIFDKYDNGITRVCKELGRIRLVREVFAEAKRANPDATLLINDFDTSESYDILIEGLLEAGIPIDVIGIQSHMHQGFWGVEKTQEILDRFSRFKLPIHFTEISLVSGDIMPPEIVDLNDYKVEVWPSTPEGEARQAEEAALFYETLYANPLVQSITWWSFQDGLWLGAPSGLLTRDSQAKPAYRELHKRIKGQWWTPEQRIMTDESGHVAVTGTFGDYVASYEREEMSFSITRDGSDC